MTIDEKRLRELGEGQCYTCGGVGSFLSGSTCGPDVTEEPCPDCLDGIPTPTPDELRELVRGYREREKIRERLADAEAQLKYLTSNSVSETTP